jgi:hypothetical protein
MRALCALLLTAATAASVFAVSPAKEKEFVDAYKKAIETKNEAGLNALLYTKGSDPQALEFFKMMMASDMGNQVTSIELAALTAADKTRLANTPSPDGKPMRMVLPPVKKLIVKSEKKDQNGSTSSSSEVYVAEFEGKLYIPVPAKQ